MSDFGDAPFYVTAPTLAERFPLLHELKRRETGPSTSETLILCRVPGCLSWKKAGTKCPTCYTDCP